MLNKISSQKFNNCGRDLILQELLMNFGQLAGYATYNSCSPLLPREKHCTYVFLNPVLQLQASAEGETIQTLNDLKQETLWSSLDQRLNRLLHCKTPVNCPCVAGFLSYELAQQIEQFSAPQRSYFELPLYLFYVYSTVLRVPIESTQALELFQFDFEPALEKFWTVPVEKFLGALKSVDPQADRKMPPMPVPSLDETYAYLGPYSNFSYESYIAAIQDIHESIRDGEVYQVNLTQLFTLPLPASPALLLAALQSNQIAAQGGYMNFENSLGGKRVQSSIISESPETFFKLNGPEIVCSPIKGTRPRLAGVSDRLTIQQLREASKDGAELAMIVDLIRNDLGKIAKIGSVKVLEHARVQTLPHAFHLVSDVQAELSTDCSLGAIIRALFPSGSITGAPKIAAMQQISRLERITRGVYTGSLGILGPNCQAEFNVAIRTVLCENGQLYFQTGGGIVIDSDPDAEFMETLVKARNIVRACWLACNNSEAVGTRLASNQ